jgi:hypothetical protein
MSCLPADARMSKADELWFLLGQTIVYLRDIEAARSHLLTSAHGFDVYNLFREIDIENRSLVT